LPSLKNAVGEKCRRSNWPSVKNAVGQNGRRSKLRRSKELEPFDQFIQQISTNNNFEDTSN
jgi:hypothetical protein